MTLGLKENLAALVRSKYAAANASGAVIFAKSQLAVPAVGGVPLQLRYCPSLAKKPTSHAAAESRPRKSFDPFEDPSTDLLVTPVPQEAPSHNIVLNKFPIIQNHFILATKVHKQQTHLLEPIDLLRTYQCVEEWGDSESHGLQTPRLFAFFNSGEHSGASQPHRHTQLLPVEEMRHEDGEAWEPLVDIMKRGRASPIHGLLSLENLPFVHFACTIPPLHSAEALWKIYIKLYSAATASVRRFRSRYPGLLDLHSTIEGGTSISYNLAMIKGLMAICPRRSEGRMVQRQDGTEIDWVALNGTLLGGTLMVKNEEAFDALQRDPRKLSEVLEAAGIPAGQGFEDLEHSELDQGNFEELRNLSSSPQWNI